MRREVLRFFSRIFKREEKLPFYNLPQSYNVSFSFELSNTTDRDISLTVVMPTPRETSYQHILTSLFFPEGVKHEKEELLGNEYSYWMLHLASHKTEVVREDATVRILPRNVDLDPMWFSIDDYNNIKERADYKLFSGSSHSIKPEDARIRAIVKKVLGSTKNVSSIIKLLNEYTISEFQYGNPIDGLYPSDAAFFGKPIDCGGFAVFLAALLRSAGIPARILSGFFAGYEKNTMHAWLEAMLPDGTWVPLDPALDHLRKKGSTEKPGSMGFIGSDRIVLSQGCDMTIAAGNTQVPLDILQTPFFIGAEKKDIVSRVSFVAAILRDKSR